MRRPGELRGWIAIAKHLDVPVTTAMEWADVRGLPVMKLGDWRGATVIAYADQLNAWWAKMLKPRLPRGLKKAVPSRAA